jgi:hypothetical protein
LSALTLIGTGDSVGWVWDYECDCGLSYRVSSVAGGARFWPANGGSSFSQHFLAAGDDCLKCRQTLSLANCAVRDARSRGDE